LSSRTLAGESDLVEIPLDEGIALADVTGFIAFDLGAQAGTSGVGVHIEATLVESDGKETAVPVRLVGQHRARRLALSLFTPFRMMPSSLMIRG